MIDVGIDLGGYSLEAVGLDEQGKRVYHFSDLVKGKPLVALRALFDDLSGVFAPTDIRAVGVTGSGWRLVKATVGAVYVGEEGELLHQWCAAKYPQADSLVKIGYEETLFCHLQQGLKRRGKKNECIRNLGAFYWEQLNRWGEAIGQVAGDDGQTDLEVHLSAKCPAFILRDLVKYEQMGLPRALLVGPMVEALVRCYLQNTAKDETFAGDIVFTGLLAESDWAAQILARLTGQKVLCAEDNRFLAAEAAAAQLGQLEPSPWSAQGLIDDQYSYMQAYCEDGCGKHCSLIRFVVNGEVKAVWGGKCDRWDNFISGWDNGR